MHVPREFPSLLEKRYNGRTNMARMRELIKELEAVTYGIRKQ